MSNRHTAYTAGCLAGMDPPRPFEVPAELKAFAEDWERGYRETCTATNVFLRPQPPKAKSLRRAKAAVEEPEAPEHVEEPADDVSDEAPPPPLTAVPMEYPSMLAALHDQLDQFAIPE